MGRPGHTAEIKANRVHGQGDQPGVDIGGNVVVGHDKMDGNGARQSFVCQLNVRL